MKCKEFVFGMIIALALSVPHAQAATPTTQVEVCKDVPSITAGASLGTCKKIGCGPVYNTDMVRTNNPTNTNSQWWQPWSKLISASAVVPCVNGSIVGTWTTKGAVTANPPSPPVATIPANGSFKLVWTAPTANVDKSAIVPPVTYVIQHGPTSGGPWDASPPSVNALSYTFVSLPIGVQQCFQVSAVTSTGMSAPLGVCVPANSVPISASPPGSPASLKITIDATQK